MNFLTQEDKCSNQKLRWYHRPFLKPNSFWRLGLQKDQKQCTSCAMHEDFLNEHFDLALLEKFTSRRMTQRVRAKSSCFLLHVRVALYKRRKSSGNLDEL